MSSKPKFAVGDKVKVIEPNPGILHSSYDPIWKKTRTITEIVKREIGFLYKVSPQLEFITPIIDPILEKYLEHAN